MGENCQRTHAEELVIKSTTVGTVSTSGQAIIYLDEATGKLRVSEDGAAFEDVTPATGSGSGFDADTVDGQHASAFESAGAVSTHEGAADPHTVYQKESEKNQASGYAGLDGSSKVAFSQLPTGSGASQVAVGNHTHGGGGFEFPVGYIVETILSDNPSVTLGYGTWVEFGAGRMLIGFDSGDPDFDTVEETGGSKTHTLTAGEMPSHSHTQDAHGHTVNDAGHTHLTQRYPTATGGSSGFTIDTSMSGTLADNTLPTKSATTGVTVNNATATNQNTGGGAAHNNMPPYIVAHRWLRTA